MANFQSLVTAQNNEATAIANLKTDTESLIALVGAEDPAIQVAINAAAVTAQANADAVDAIDAEVKAKLGQ